MLPGLVGAAPRGQQPRWRCGEAVRYVARPRQAELRSGARPGRLRRCSALSLWPAWAADRRRFSLLRTCSDCCGGCSGGLWLRRSTLGHQDRPHRLHRPAALRARRSSWPGRCPRAGPSRWRLLVVRSGGRGRLCVWRRNALALRVSWLSYTYIVQLLSDGAPKSHAARPCDSDSALPCSAATHNVPRVGRFRRGEVMEGCAGGAAGRSKGLICLRVT